MHYKENWKTTARSKLVTRSHAAQTFKAGHLKIALPNGNITKATFTMYRVSQKQFTLVAECGIKSMWPVFNSEMLIYQSKANLDEKDFLDRITCL